MSVMSMGEETIGDILRSNDKLTSYAMKFAVAPSKDRKGTVHKRRQMKVPKSSEMTEAVY